ncbi:MAG: molecular chaperone HtpG [Deltaproteobacteria bacterium]|nr:molecular chaperone HtpG [Deltaproteobacteria bacterium]
MAAEKFEFQAEVKQLLDLMIHSLYSNRDVFLRELISNASDACDRLRFEGLTDSELLPEEPFAVNIHVDPEARVLSVSDNGIGMSREEVAQNIGTIAKSGTSEFLSSLSKSADPAISPELIGQFGVGFYASFMVAEEVSVITRKAGAREATRWASSGDGSYEIEETDRDAAGTTISLKLKAAEGDEAIANYTDEWLLRQIVKRFSDFVAYPIHLKIEGADPPSSTEPLNSMKAIWRRPDEEVGEEEYAEFYKHIAHDWNEPLLHFATKIEGNFEARALLYLPSLAPFDLYHREMAHRGIQLYVKRVFIMDECRELMPEYLRFAKGVVDAEDLSLNVSREMLQQSAQIEVIRKHLVKKTLDALKELKESDREKYQSFWTQFGPVIKEGLLDLSQKRERILELVLCESTAAKTGSTSLAEAVARMPEDQEVIYYLTGPSREHLVNSPHVEAFVDRNIEVLLFTDHVDEIWLEQNPPEFSGKKFQSVLKGEIDLDSAADKERDDAKREQDAEEFKQLLDALRAGVQDHVKEVRVSNRLTSSPACLVVDEGDLSPQISELLRRSGQNVPDVKPILEINPTHPLLAKLKAVCDADAKDPRLADYATLLFGQAMLAEGGQLEDPAAFSRRIAELMLETL